MSTAPDSSAASAAAAPAPAGIPLTFDAALAELVDFDKDGGLVPAVVQDAVDGTVLTVAA